MSRFLVAVGALLALVALAGCRGVDPVEVAAPAGPAPPWALEADALCRKQLEQIGRLGAPPKQTARLASWLDAALEARRSWLRSLRGLGAPAGEEAEVKAMLVSYGGSLQLLEYAAEALGGGLRERYREFVGESRVWAARGDDVAQELGAGPCSFPAPA